MTGVAAISAGVPSAGGVFSLQPPVQGGGIGGMPVPDKAVTFELPKPIQASVQSPVAGSAELSSRSFQPATFGHLMHQMVSEVNQKQVVAGEKVRDVLMGKAPVHEAMIAMEESNVSMTLLTEARNKFVEAYQEIMRMQM